MDASTIVQKVKQAIIDMEGRVSVSEIYLTCLDTQEQVEFCMTTESIRVKTSAAFRTFNIVERGEVKIPKGEQLQSVSWRGILPAAAMLMYPFVRHAQYEKPTEVVKVLGRWRSNGSKLRLLVTQTPINLDVYIKSFGWTAKGGLGHLDYEIEFLAAKMLRVMTVAESDAARARAQTSNAYELQARMATKSKAGVYMANVNSIWQAAQLLTGHGDWQALMSANGLDNPFNIDPTEIILH